MAIMEAIKANKKAIVKKALIIGGTLAGLVLVMKFVPKGSSEFEMTEPEMDAEEESTVQTEDI